MTSLSPIFADDGKVGGLVNISTESTSTVLMTRQLKTITDLTNRTQGNYLDNYGCVINSNDGF